MIGILVDSHQHTLAHPSNTQQIRPDEGLICLVLIARLMGKAADPDQIRHQFAKPGQPLGQTEIKLAARHLGLKTQSTRSNIQKLARSPLPALAQVNSEDGNTSYVVIAKVVNENVLIQSPSNRSPESISLKEFESRWTGELMLFASMASVIGELRKFDLSWFIPSLVKYRKLLAEVLVVSAVIQLLGLLTPLFFQVVMDKVLVHRGFTTLDVIGLAMIMVVLFEISLSGLRTYVFAHTTSRIDVELGSRIFSHLLKLPISYFQARRTGDSIARVREVETIRSFLTSHALTTVLDLVFSIIFIAVMAYYSGLLTLVVLGSIPFYVVVSVVITPALRARLNEKFHRGAENQAFLVESVANMDTIKSMAVEPLWLRHWDEQLAVYVRASFRTTVLSMIAQNGVTLISKIVTVLTMYFGARLVIEGKLSIGQLIAFNMLAGQVSQPVLRLAQLWSDFQQVGISVQRLGDILNTRTEAQDSRTGLPAIQGKISLRDLSFSYSAGGKPVLQNIDLEINTGEVIGVVGRSGSGKSTLAKLIQRLHVPSSGSVMVDGVDLSIIDASSLRRQLGVVMQENVLFNRSIRDNIALTDPGASIESVIEAARLAGADEFISQLPEGYATVVGEDGCNLSGGQRQRIAIARALLTNPRILIFDEATSALDYESELIIRRNMRRICEGRTVIIIAHRLTAVRDANRIIVMHEGRMIEQGSHDQLIGLQGGQYAKLHGLQSAGVN